MSKFIFALVMMVPFLASGQFVKGDKFLGGYVRVSSQGPTQSGTGSGSSQKGFSIDPRIGFLVSEKFAVGGGIGYSHFNSTYRDPFNQREYNSKGVLAGVIARRYFAISERFIFAINGNLNYDRGTESQDNGSLQGTTKNYGISIGFVPTFIFFPSPQWGFETGVGSLSYSYSRNLTTDADNSYFDCYAGSLSFGVSYYFRKAK